MEHKCSYVLLDTYQTPSVASTMHSIGMAGGVIDMHWASLSASVSVSPLDEPCDGRQPVSFLLELFISCESELKMGSRLTHWTSGRWLTPV